MAIFFITFLYIPVILKTQTEKQERKMNNKILPNIKNKVLTIIAALLATLNVANAQNTNDMVQDSLAKNKEYNKLLKTVRINEPQIKELEFKIYNTKAEMAVLQDMYRAQTKKQIVRQSTINKFFTPKQISQINQELGAFGEFSLLTPKSTLDDLHKILIQLNIPVNQLPLNGRAIVKSKYADFDLRHINAWFFPDEHMNNMYLHYLNLIKQLRGTPQTFDFKNLVARLKEYEAKCAQLGIAKQRAIIIKKAVNDYFHRAN